MTPPLTPLNTKLALLVLVCTGVLGGALLFSHARHNPLPPAPVTVSPDQREDLPPVW